MAAIKALEQWCKVQCEDYRDVAITNMTTSFRNGLAFCALIHKYRPDLINYDSLRKEDVFENNRLAFQIAEEKLGIPALLDAEDMVALRIPDRLSILTYVSQYYNYFKGRPPMGGVKRPAEGSKEEPSEKKNHPVVAKTFQPKKAIEKCSPSVHSVRPSSNTEKPAAEKVVLTDTANKSGTLNSKCVACKNHVHLVQRHFVEGKLYHRSCFKCIECSSVLHAGGYKPGRNPDTFVCNSHQNSSKTSSSAAEIKYGGASSVVQPASVTQKQQASHFPSVLSAPVHTVLKPLSPNPQSQSWTASAQKTQAARQKFFQTAPHVTEASTGLRKPVVQLENPKVPLSSDEKNCARLKIGRKLAEENCNNNNGHLFTIRSAERRFFVDPVSADFPSLRKDKCSQDPAGNGEGPSSTSQTNKKKSQCQTINKDNTRPTTVHKTAKESSIQEWQTKLKPVKTDPKLQDSEPVLTEDHTASFMSTTPCHVSISTRTPSAPTPAVLGFALFDPVSFREINPQKPPPASENHGFKHRCSSPVKSPLRPLTLESISSSTTVSGNPENQTAAKKGKYLSPTNAFRTEMRSPSVKSYHIPVEQIEKELEDIEINLGQLEKEGVELEKKLRSCEDQEDGDVLMDPLMVDWFNLIRKKQMYIRKESELVYIARTQELEQQQPGVEGELRRLLEKPDHLKSREEQQQEKKLMQRLMEIVDGRNEIVEVLDEDRLREVEEDQQLNKMMQDLGVKKTKNRRKSSFSKMFRRRSKRQVE
ncbi:MICAL-like protein 2a isoform X2 [Kryptolebias marmoratus]|uniref:Mical-like 2a n=1 Tax=Kryptolebias marmoratus TaxID=37003 RepID=A0A3Q3BKT2_KRYMA|nr:MICAL-like protein 2a isoform X2 [Kryptolebias marmoratus]